MTAEDTRILLRSDQSGVADQIVDHPQQPFDYIQPFPDGPIWTWHQHQGWRVVDGVPMRVYEIVVSIVLRGGRAGAADQIVDHPRQPADYVHTDGRVWTWHKRWRLVGGSWDDKGRIFRTHVRAYDLVPSDNDA
jgi:hypothetical protein